MEIIHNSYHYLRKLGKQLGIFFYLLIQWFPGCYINLVLKLWNGHITCYVSFNAVACSFSIWYLFPLFPLSEWGWETQTDWQCWGFLGYEQRGDHQAFQLQICVCIILELFLLFYQFFTTVLFSGSWTPNFFLEFRKLIWVIFRILLWSLDFVNKFSH